MGAIELGRVVSAALDPVLEPEGFASGQYGEGGVDRPGPAQIIFCASHDDLSDRHPLLPQAGDQERGVRACIDLVVDVDAGGTIESLTFEGFSLEDTLRLAGHGRDADMLTGIAGQPLSDGLPVIAAALTRLLASA